VPARAQTTAPITRADVAVATGWFAADRSGPGSCCWSSSLFRGVAGGFYWTDHVKTELELAAPGPTEGHSFFTEPLANGSYRYTSEQHSVTFGRLSLSQAYQFGHNSTFHPFVRAGVDIDRERDEIESYAQTRNGLDERTRVANATRVRGFGGVGFKAYFNERAFFRGEARFSPGRNQLDQMAWTAGVGVDFPSRRRAAPATAGAQLHASDVPPSRAPEPIELWRTYASTLKIGARVDVVAAGANRLVGDLVAVDDSAITIKPNGRLSETPRRIPFEQLEALALHTGPAPGSRVAATAAGTFAGIGMFGTLLMVLLAHID